MEIYSGISRFPCGSKAFFLSVEDWRWRVRDVCELRFRVHGRGRVGQMITARSSLCDTIGRGE